jgi:hypothetical protein
MLNRYAEVALDSYDLAEVKEAMSLSVIFNPATFQKKRVPVWFYALYPMPREM